MMENKLHRRKKRKIKKRLRRKINIAKRIMILVMIFLIPMISVNLIINIIKKNINSQNSENKTSKYVYGAENDENETQENGNKTDNEKNRFKYLSPKLKIEQLADVNIPEWIDVQIIEIDGESRRGEDLEDINDIVVHYVGNPRTSAQQNHDFYENDDSEVSSHFVVGLEGEIIECVPLNEKSSANNWRNSDTISIEVCHPDSTGEFTDETYTSLVKLTAWLVDTCDLDVEHVIRHYDITGKECPRYFVDHEDAWNQFKRDVKKQCN